MMIGGSRAQDIYEGRSHDDLETYHGCRNKTTCPVAQVKCKPKLQQSK